MKKYILIILCCCSINTYAQKSRKTDSVYYLLDTTKISERDRIWNVHLEYPSLKIYSIQCPCLAYESRPTFVHRLNDNDQKQRLIKTDIENLKLITLVKLISLSKLITSKMIDRHIDIFIIEPIGKKYVLNKVYLIKPTKPRNPSIDYENITPLDTTKQ